MADIIRNQKIFWNEELLKSGQWGAYISIPKDFIIEYHLMGLSDYGNSVNKVNDKDIELYLSSHFKSITIPIKSTLQSTVIKSGNKSLLNLPVGSAYDSNQITISIIENHEQTISSIFNCWFKGIEDALNAKWCPSKAISGPTIYMGYLFVWLADNTNTSIKFSYFMDYVYPINNIMPSDFSEEVNDKILYQISFNANFSENNTPWVNEKVKTYHKALRNKMIEKLSVIFE